MNLVVRIQRIQEAHSWTDQQTAQWLGISRPMWSGVKSGSTRFGGRSLKAMRQRHPELSSPIDAYLAEEPEAAA